MAEKFFVSPESNEVVAIPEENAEKALSLKYVPATDSQIANFKAREEAAASPVSSFAKRATEVGVSALNPADIAYGVLSLPTQKEATDIMAGYLAEKPWGWAQEASKAIRAGQALTPQGIDEDRAGREAIKDRLRAFTTPQLEVGLGITTPEAYRARAETGPRVNLPLLGETPVADLFGLIGAATVPRKLANLALSGESKIAQRAAAEAAHEEAMRSARRTIANKVEADALTQEGVAAGSPSVILSPSELNAQRLRNVLSQPTPDVTAAIDAANEAGEAVVDAAKAAEARKAVLSKVRGGEKIAKGVERALRAGAGSNALELVSDVAGRPVSQMAEASARSLIEKAPALRKAPQVVKDIVARTIASGAGSAADMSLLSLGQIPQEELLGDTRVTGERALSMMKDGAIAGLVPGLALGAIPPTVAASLDGINAASSKIRNGLLDIYERVSPRFTGAAPESYQVLREMRDQLHRPDAVDLIKQKLEERMGPPPTAPTLRAVPSAEPIVTDVPQPPKPPVEPTYYEKLPKPSEPNLKPEDFDRAAIELARALQERRDNVMQLGKDLFTKYRPVEEGPLVNHYYDLLAEKVRSDFEQATNGRKLNAKENKFLIDLMGKVYDAPRAEALRLAQVADSIIERVGNDTPRAIPTAELEQINVLADKLRALAANKEALPSQIYNDIGVIKGQAFDINKPLDRNVTISQEEAVGRRAANDLGHALKNSLETEATWGPNAVREQKINSAWTDVVTTDRNLLRELGVAEDVGIKERERVYDADDVKKFLMKLGGAEKDTVLRYLQEHEVAIPKFVNEVRETLKKYDGPHNLEAVADSIGRAAEAYTAGENQYFAQVENQYAAEQFKKTKADYERANQWMTEENRKLQEDYEARKEAAAAETEKYKAQVGEMDTTVEQGKAALKEKQKAVEADNTRLQQRFQEQLDSRKAAIARQVELIKAGAKLGALGDTLQILKSFGLGSAGTGIAIMGHPLIGGGIATVGTAYGALHNPIHTYRTIAAIERLVGKSQKLTGDLVSYAVGDVRSAPAEVKPATRTLSASQKRDLFEQRKAQIEDLNTPRGLADHLDRIGEGLDTSAPKLANYSRNASAIALAYLNNTLPKPPPTLSPIQQANYVPPDNKVDEWLKRDETVRQPLGAVYRLAEGSATGPEVETLNTVYPALMEDVRNRLLKRLRENPNMPAERRRIISRILGVDVDGAIAGGAIAQGVYAQQNQPPPQGGQKQMPVSRAKTLNAAGRTSLEMSEDQQGARR